MQITIAVAGQTYTGEVLESQVQALVEQGIRYRLLNTDKVRRQHAFQSCLSGREVSEASIVSALKGMDATKLQELLQANGLI